jgi:EmrB/QacA subfamily drug resistance transporter
MIGAHRPPCDEGIIRATPCAGRALPPGRKRRILAATILGSSLAFIDGSVVNVALPAIQRGLAADAAAAQWIVNAYLLLLGALVLIGGALGDRFGRRRVFLIGICIFTAASVGCGLAPNVATLIGARALQGLGAALLTPASLAILGASFDERERGAAIGAWAGFGALTTAAGPVLGGWLVDAVSWRAIFLINVPLAGAAILLTLRAVPESRDDGAARLDWAGAALVSSGLAALAWGLTALPERGLASPAIIAALLGGAALLLAFLWTERASANAMMPLALYRSRVFSGVNLLTFLLYFALAGALFFLPYALIRLGGYSATAAGAALLPFALVMGLGSPIAGQLADRFDARLLLVGGPVVAAAGLVLLALAELEKPYRVAVLPGILVLALGMTLTVAPLTATVMGAVDERHAGLASGVNNAVARVASLLAVAALGVILFVRFSAGLPMADPGAARAALDAVMAGRPVPGAEHAFAEALRLVILVCAGCALAAGASAAALIPGSPRPGGPR